MKQNNLKSSIQKFTPQKKRAVAEVISSLLLVAITVVGAVILTTFLDEAFISGGLSASGSDVTVKSIKLKAFDSRDGAHLMGFTNLNNTSPVDQKLCRASCSGFPNSNPINPSPGTEFFVIQIENRGINPIFLETIWLDNATHRWDLNTANIPLNLGVASSINGDFPGDGKFSILPEDPDDVFVQQNLIQFNENKIENGQIVNLLIKLDTSNPDIELSKTIRAQFNIGANQLAEMLIESGGAQ